MSKERSAFSNDLHKSTLEQHVPTLFFDLQRRCFVKKGVLKNFANFTVKQLFWNLLLLKLQALQALQLYSKRLQHRCFFVELAKLLRTSILQNIYKRLLLVFLEAFDLHMLRDKRRRFIRMFQKDETTISPPHLKKRLVERLKVSVENSS